MGKASPNEYRLRFFRDSGFVRKQCRVCGEFFWTKDPSRETCEDAPCVHYRFHEIPRRVGPLDVAGARKVFIDFFARNGHEPVKPRPVVARWRDDLYLTIASIVVFQPFVTSGVVPPPANPLVISQPCIRLEDIDNVGITFGRHLTSFEMAAHHAFNYPDRKVYWKEKTVELAYRFFTEELGIPSDELVFKESWWEGGGNAGPSFEVTVGGLELATLVFMQYKVVDGKYEEIPLKIVDTGYGVERIAWFTNTSAYTAFDAIFGDMVGEFFDKLGVPRPRAELLKTGLIHAGHIDPDVPQTLDSLYTTLASELGESPRSIKEELERAAMVYAVLDHTRTLSLMLGDGIVPSNSGEGYLARLVLRRALRLLRRLGSDASLKELVELQLRFWGRDFPQLVEHRDYILDAVSYEEQRYRETLERGRITVSKLLGRKRSLSVEDLVVLYDSHGIPPDLVAEEAARHGVPVEIPHNFYSIVASRHSGGVAKPREAPGVPEDLAEWASGFPPTRRLFHEDPYMRRFRAKVLGVRGRALVLDQTAFYPRGGGQDADTGVVELDGGARARVVDTVKVGDVIVHMLSEGSPAPREGSEVWCEIDWERRYTLMRHHTATHIILGAARRVLGEHVWQAGAEKTVEKARLDITHHRPLTRKQVEEIERLANQVVLERRPVRAVFMERNRAEEKYGFRLYQGGVPPDPVIRILEVEGWDVQACFGTHLGNTGEVGAIKIVNVDKIQDGVVRLEYVAGTRVAEEMLSLEKRVELAASRIGASKEDFDRRVEKLVQELGALRRAVFEYAGIIAELEKRKMLAEAREFRGIKVYVGVPMLRERKQIQELLKRAVAEEPRLAVVMVYTADSGRALIEAAAGEEAVRNGFDASGIVRLLARRFGGKGGGKPSHATGSAPAKPGQVVEEAWKLVEEFLESG